MARKRGGLAGIYDRNKKYIKTLAPIAAGFIPGVGPLVGAALGAAMGGDTEGKGYFKGFNAGGAVKGGLSGYGGAKLGQAAKGGLAKMFTASPLDKLTGAPQVGLTAGGPSSYGTMGSFQPTMAGGAGGSAATAAPTAAYTGNVGGYGIGVPLGSAAPVPSSAMGDLPAMDMAKMRRLTQTTGGAPLPNIPAPQMGAMPQISNKTQSFFSKAGTLAKDAAKGTGKFFKENKDLIAMARPDAASDAKYMDAETNRMRLDDEREQMKMEQERRRRMAELLMPMFTQMQSRPSYGYGG